jgi:hypothetical protein
MFVKKWIVAVAVLTSLGTAGVGLAAGQSADAGRRPARTSWTPDATRLYGEASLLYNYVKMRRPGELKWQRVAWMTDLSEALREARAENRPILIWATDDEPLERC